MNWILAVAAIYWIGYGLLLRALNLPGPGGLRLRSADYLCLMLYPFTVLAILGILLWEKIRRITKRGETEERPIKVQIPSRNQA